MRFGIARIGNDGTLQHEQIRQAVREAVIRRGGGACLPMQRGQFAAASPFMGIGQGVVQHRVSRRGRVRRNPLHHLHGFIIQAEAEVVRGQLQGVMRVIAHEPPELSQGRVRGDSVARGQQRGPALVGGAEVGRVERQRLGRVAERFRRPPELPQQRRLQQPRLIVAAVPDERALSQLERLGIAAAAAGDRGQREVAAVLPGGGPDGFVEGGKRLFVPPLELQRQPKLVQRFAVVRVRVTPGERLHR
ncbi:hypothetical protein D3C81_1236810 [compost metagenome]